MRGCHRAGGSGKQEKLPRSPGTVAAWAAAHCVIGANGGSDWAARLLLVKH